MDENTDFTSTASAQSPEWGAGAPKGGRTVLNRMLREGTRVPLFLGQTFVSSLRDVGYNSTTSAICEHVDNSIQAGASEIRIYFNQTGRKGNIDVDVLVYDNGVGMAPHVLQVATSFGGSMHFDDRRGIGRFGVGMKTAALSMGPVLELYSWQEPGAIYNMILDVNAIGASRSDLIELPEPTFMGTLPPQLVEMLTAPMVFPKDPNRQDLLALDEDGLIEGLGSSGTIVFIPQCDRLTNKQAKTLTDNATKEMARIYRRQLGEGLRLFVNNRQLEAFDPTYWMTNARHTKIEGVGQARSRLINSWPDIQIPVQEDSNITAPASVKLYMLPMEEWYGLPRVVLKNQLQLFDDHLVSFMRNDREVHIGTVPDLSGKRHADAIWMRIQVDFDGRLDEAFGVAMNKQGVRPKKYALNIIREKIREDVSKVRDQTARYRAEQTSKGSKAKLSDAERRAQEADRFQGKPLPRPNPETEEERKELEHNLRALALTLKRHGESDDEAFERIRDSSYITTFKHDEYWPFYHIDFQLGKVILTINTAHPFFTKLYEPLSKLGGKPVNGDEEGSEATDGEAGNNEAGELLVALQMVLLSLGRAQSQMIASDASDEQVQLFETLRTEWSLNLKTQLMTA